MTAAIEDIANLPYWPLELSEEQAAAYVGVSIALFKEEVEAGIWPNGWQRGKDGKRRRYTWNRLELDAARSKKPQSISDVGDLPWGRSPCASRASG